MINVRIGLWLKCIRVVETNIATASDAFDCFYRLLVGVTLFQIVEKDMHSSGEDLRESTRDILVRFTVTEH